MKPSPIISIEEFLRIFRDPHVLIFDARGGADAKARYTAEHIEGARFVDLDTQLADIKEDVAQGGRHPLPAIEKFTRMLGELGISKNKHVVIYDDKNGSNAAARFWWMLRSVGHEKVQVLNGGLNKANRDKLPLCAGTVLAQQEAMPYHAEKWNLPVSSIGEVEKVSLDPNYLIVDVRDKARYDGLTEPIDLVAGHIPGAINIPFTENLDGNGYFLSPDTLKTKYTETFGETEPRNIIVHCGSGVTACHTLLALAHAEMEIPKLYVGSWSEWSRNNKKIEKVNP